MPTALTASLKSSEMKVHEDCTEVSEFNVPWPLHEIQKVCLFVCFFMPILKLPWLKERNGDV